MLVVLLTAFYVLVVSGTLIGTYRSGDAGFFWVGLVGIAVATAVLGFWKPVAGFLGPIAVAVVWAVAVASDASVGYVAVAESFVALELIVVVAALARLGWWAAGRRGG